MALTIWTEHGPGYRSPHFFARIAESLGRSHHPAIYVVPNAAAKRRAEDLCLSQGPGIFFGDRILTTSAWIRGIAAPRGPILSDPQRHAIIRTLLKTVPLDYFRSSAATPSTCALIARGMTSALGAGLSATELLRLARDYGQEREQDLAALFEAYLARLQRDHGMDAAQLPLAAIDTLRSGAPIAARRIIVETGIAPAPILWKVLRAIQEHPASPDLHVVTPEYQRSRAESELGVLAQEIRSDEWVAAAATPESVQLYRAPQPTAQYRWMARQLLPETRVLSLTADVAPWLEACMSEGIVTRMALPLSLAASPVSAPWFDRTTWDRAPTSATLSDWKQWWRQQLYPEAQILNLQEKIAADDFACRTLRDIAQWESVWLRAAASAPAQHLYTPATLRVVVDPLLQTSTSLDGDALPFTFISWLSHLGEPIPRLLVLDASQSLLPNAAGTLPFFKSAALLPQDPNAQRLRDAFPSADAELQLQIAAWQRLSGCTSEMIASYSATADANGEQFPSLLLDAVPRDIPAPPVNVAPTGAAATPETLLVADDTLAHVRQRMETHTFSITELEAFAECPFRHFARYILGITIPDEEGPEISPRDEGKLVHRLLERFYRSPHPELRDLFGDARTDVARAILGQILAHEVETTAPLRQIQIDRLLQMATQAVQLDLATRDRLGQAALEPAYLEWTFGGKDAPPLTLTTADSAPVHIGGMVDRIDIHPATRQLLLIDYKTGKVESIIGDIRKGLHLQIPIYLLAAQSVFSDFKVLGGLLFDLQHVQRHHGMARKAAAEFLGIEGRYQSLTQEETWHDLLQTASDHAVSYASQILRGHHPVGEHTCTYCDWKGLLPWEE